MTLKKAYDEGARSALNKFRVLDEKIANMIRGAAGSPSLNPAQSSATAMPSAMPKPVTPPTAPMATGASKANVLG
jgi:hypothetical protein